MSTGKFKKSQVPGLATARKRLGLSQGQLSEQIGIGANIVAHFERGRRAPSWVTAVKLADELGITLDELAGRESSPTATGPALRKLLELARRLSARDIELLVTQAEALAKYAARL